nr:branched-chain amino acid aminotransferase [uncultured bacterium]
MLDYKTSQVYLDGNLVPFKDANISIASSPVLYGLTIYTVFCLNWNDQQQKLYAFRLKDHFKRLVNSARIMDFGQFINDWTYEKFEQTMLELISKNNVREDALVRVAVYVDELIAGTKIHGLKNSVSAYIYPMGEILPLTGINACVSSWVRTQDNAMPSRAKINGSYVNASLMKNEAVLNGYDEAIALDHNGHVAEGTVANIFIVKNGTLITPDDSTDILEGITRSSILQIARDLDLRVKQCAIDRSELYIADEVFMCGSSARIAPILSIDKRPIGNGQIGKVTGELMKYYKEVQLGNNSAYTHWLHQV